MSILRKFKWLDYKTVSTPCDFSTKLSNIGGTWIDQLKYASIIRSFIYAMHSTRLDIAFVIRVLSRYTHSTSY